MPWKEQTLMSLRVQFVQSLLEGDSSLSQLCRQFGISRKTAYKWIARFREGGWSALADRSKRPIHSPTRTEDSTEDAVLRVRDLHKAWGARKIASFLSNQGFHQLPAPSTITAILRRHGRIDPFSIEQAQAFHPLLHAKPKPALADGFQRSFHAWRWSKLPSSHHTR